MEINQNKNIHAHHKNFKVAFPTFRWMALFDSVLFLFNKNIFNVCFIEIVNVVVILLFALNKNKIGHISLKQRKICHTAQLGQFAPANCDLVSQFASHLTENNRKWRKQKQTHWAGN